MSDDACRDAPDPKPEPDGSGEPESDTDADRAHLDGIEDGCGCAEVWEHLSERRGEGSEAKSKSGSTSG